MKIQDLFENWGIKGLSINAGFLKIDWEPQPEEEQAAWDLYIELVTRVTTQALSDENGDEKCALDSVFSLFESTRSLLKQRGRKAQTFSKIAIIVLNQKVRPFTAKWHPVSLAGGFDDPEKCIEFRKDLKEIQQVLHRYAGMLSSLAGVEDFDSFLDGPLESI